ncbi:hypothetical protein OAA08_00950, partial [bacterium]|nr:hypothetical protein [bacterium]
KSAAMIAGEGLKLAFIAPIAFITDSFGKMVTKFGQFSSIFGENDISIAIKDFGASIKDTLNPIDDFNYKVRQIAIDKTKAIAATRTLTMEMMDESGAAKIVTSEVLKTGSAVSEFEFKTKKGTAALEENKKALKEQQKALKAAADEVKLAKATGTDLIKSQDELNKTLDESLEHTKNYSKALETARQVLLSRGLIEGTKEYENALKSLGLETEKTTTVMSEYWERFANGAFDSFKTFTKSAFTDFKTFGDSLKNLAKDIVSDLIATFASNKLKDIFKNLFSGGEGASSGGFLDSIKDVFGGGSDSGVSGIFKSLFGGTTSEVGPTQPGAISGLFASGGLFSSTGKIGGLFAKGGLFGSGGSMAESFASLTELINPYTAAIAAVIAMGGAID